MKASIKNRELYHPRIDDNTRLKRGQRHSWARLRLLQSKVDFTGKTVLDLGCSGGFFAFSVARQAKHVIAVDADLHMIERNRREAKRLDCNNIEFVHAHIEPEFVASLPQVDIMLFLSVFHHILAVSDIYEWNRSTAEPQNPILLLEQIRQLADTYVFEMGEPWEPRAEWAVCIGAKIGDLKNWIPNHVFGPNYKSIQTLSGVAYQRWPFSRWPNLSRIAWRTRVGRTLLRQFGFLRGDFRTLYIGQRG